MNIKDQCISLELAKRLKELNVNQESYFEYLLLPYSGEWEISPRFKNKIGYSAFTVAELMNILPAFIDIKKNEPFNNFWFHLNKRSALNIQYISGYFSDTFTTDDSVEHYGINPWQSQKLFTCYDEKLSDCLAKVLIHLIENNYITLGKNDEET